MDLREEAVRKIAEDREKTEKAVNALSGDAKGRSAGSVFWRCFGFILLLPLSGLTCLAASFIIENLAIGSSDWLYQTWVVRLIMLLALTGLYLLFRKKLIPAVAVTNGVLAGVLILGITVLMVVTKGNTNGKLLTETARLLAFASGNFFAIWGMKTESLLIFVVIGPVLAFFLSVILQKRWGLLKKAIPFLAAGALCIGASVMLYANRPAVRYSGHGFEYMHGWSSTDFSGYMVWSEPSKLAALDHPASLIIEEEKDMPRLDGAEACFPLYSAAAKAVYKDIAAIEERYKRGEGLEQEWEKWNVISENGRIVSFTNTVNAFNRLMAGTVDIVFGARPSKDQLETAALNKISITVTPIGKEAFVFFVEPDNPVTDLSSDQIRAIYHGDITNWKEVGGKNQKIVAFQRPEKSGSQAMMEYFMGDVSLKKPQTYEYVDAMMGVFERVAQYHNEKGAFGYSFRYFAEDLHQENDVRLIAVDGVLPTRENIENGSYPLTVDLCTISRETDKNPYVGKMIEFMLSEDGQELVEKSGYGRVN